MVAVDVTGKISTSALVRDAMLGKPTASYADTNTTITLTWVITPGGDMLNPTSITVDHAVT